MRNRLIISLLVAVCIMLGLILATGLSADSGKQLLGWVIARKLTVINASDLQGTLDVGDATTLASTLDVATSIAVNSVTFSGPIKYGIATGIGDGSTIAHGMGTTPTVAIVTPYSTTAPLSVTQVMITALDTTSMTVAITPAITLTLYWMAGK